MASKENILLRDPVETLSGVNTPLRDLAFDSDPDETIKELQEEYDKIVEEERKKKQKEEVDATISPEIERTEPVQSGDDPQKEEKAIIDELKATEEPAPTEDGQPTEQPPQTETPEKPQPTEDVEETSLLDKAKNWFKEDIKKVDAIGVGTAIATGLSRAVVSLGDTAEDLINDGMNLLGITDEEEFFKLITKESYNTPLTNNESIDSDIEKGIQFIAPFIVGGIGLAKWAGNLKRSGQIGNLGYWTRIVGGEMGLTFVLDTPSDANFANWLNQYPALKNPVLQTLALKKEDKKTVARLKNSIIDGVLVVGADLAIRGVVRGSRITYDTATPALKKTVDIIYNGTRAIKKIATLKDNLGKLGKDKAAKEVAEKAAKEPDKLVDEVVDAPQDVVPEEVERTIDDRVASMTRRKDVLEDAQAAIEEQQSLFSRQLTRTIKEAGEPKVLKQTQKEQIPEKVLAREVVEKRLDDTSKKLFGKEAVPGEVLTLYGLEFTEEIVRGGILKDTDKKLKKFFLARVANSAEFPKKTLKKRVEDVTRSYKRMINEGAKAYKKAMGREAVVPDEYLKLLTYNFILELNLLLDISELSAKGQLEDFLKSKYFFSLLKRIEDIKDLKRAISGTASLDGANLMLKQRFAESMPLKAAAKAEREGVETAQGDLARYVTGNQSANTIAGLLENSTRLGNTETASEAIELVTEIAGRLNRSADGSIPRSAFNGLLKGLNKAGEFGAGLLVEGYLSSVRTPIFAWFANTTSAIQRGAEIVVSEQMKLANIKKNRSLKRILADPKATDRAKEIARELLPRPAEKFKAVADAWKEAFWANGGKAIKFIYSGETYAGSTNFDSKIGRDGMVFRMAKKIDELVGSGISKIFSDGGVQKRYKKIRPFSRAGSTLSPTRWIQATEVMMDPVSLAQETYSWIYREATKRHEYGSPAWYKLVNEYKSGKRSIDPIVEKRAKMQARDNAQRKPFRNSPIAGVNMDNNIGRLVEFLIDGVNDIPVLREFAFPIFVFSRTMVSAADSALETVPGLSLASPKVRNILSQGTNQQRREMFAKWSIGTLGVFTGYTLAQNDYMNTSTREDRQLKTSLGVSPYYDTEALVWPIKGVPDATLNMRFRDVPALFPIWVGARLSDLVKLANTAETKADLLRVGGALMGVVAESIIPRNFFEDQYNIAQALSNLQESGSFNRWYITAEPGDLFPWSNNFYSLRKTTKNQVEMVQKVEFDEVTKKKMDGWGALVNKLYKSFRRKIKFNTSLPTQIDRFGQPVRPFPDIDVNDLTWWGHVRHFTNTYINPFPVKGFRKDPVRRALYRLFVSPAGAFDPEKSPQDLASAVFGMPETTISHVDSAAFPGRVDVGGTSVPLRQGLSRAQREGLMGESEKIRGKLEGARYELSPHFYGIMVNLMNGGTWFYNKNTQRLVNIKNMKRDKKLSKQWIRIDTGLESFHDRLGRDEMLLNFNKNPDKYSDIEKTRLRVHVLDLEREYRSKGKEIFKRIIVANNKETVLYDRYKNMPKVGAELEKAIEEAQNPTDEREEE